MQTTCEHTHTATSAAIHSHGPVQQHAGHSPQADDGDTHPIEALVGRQLNKAKEQGLREGTAAAAAGGQHLQLQLRQT